VNTAMQTAKRLAIASTVLAVLSMPVHILSAVFGGLEVAMVALNMTCIFFIGSMLAWGIYLCFDLWRSGFVSDAVKHWNK
jgi:hypothetical protein